MTNCKFSIWITANCKSSSVKKALTLAEVAGQFWVGLEVKHSCKIYEIAHQHCNTETYNVINKLKNYVNACKNEYFIFSRRTDTSVTISDIAHTAITQYGPIRMPKNVGPRNHLREAE